MSEESQQHSQQQQPAQQMFLAKALYDNVAETPDELAFRRGDVITVLQQDAGGLDGWWLCALRNRQGIAPGNRLKILSGMLDGMTSLGRHAAPPGGGSNRSPGGDGLDNEAAARREWRRSGEQSPTKVGRRSVQFYPSNNVISASKKGDIYLCNQPNRSMDDYDVPPTRYYPSSKESSPEPPTPTDLYDTPTSLPKYRSNNNSSGSLYETPPSSKRASSERTPPGSNRASLDSLASSSSRLSGDLLQQVYQTPPNSQRASGDSSSVRLSGGDRHYETPPGSKRSSLERILSDDQPTYDTPSPSAALRSLEAAAGAVGQPRYDRPPFAARNLEPPGEGTYDTPNPSSNASSRRQSRESTGLGSRSSILSTASSESGLSSNFGLSGAASMTDSARSSLDASLHEPYDLPPRESRALKQLSCDSGLGLYDSPGVGRSGLPPPHAVSCSSRLSDYTRGDKPSPQADMKRSRSLEHAIDSDYDLPRNNAPKISLKSVGVHQADFGRSLSGGPVDPNAVYDIPPQVTRDSIISARSDSSDDSVRLSSCSVDSRGSGASAEYAAVAAEGLYEELLLDMDSALELLVKLQQDVTRACSRLLAFVSSTWRTKESLQSRVYEIKVACGELKKTLGDLVHFAQGTVGNSSRLSDRKLVSRLVKQVTPLDQRRKDVSVALKALEDMKWQVALLTEPPEGGAGQLKEDHLGKITSLASDLVPEVKKLASLIQGNSTLLFKRSADLAAQSRDKTPVVSKPPIGPKPDPLTKPFNLLEATKGSVGGVGVVIQRPRSVQSRPLPAPPLKSSSDRPLPPTPGEPKGLSQKLTGSLDNLRDYINIKTLDDEDDGDRDYSDLQQEYDYVQLQSCDVIAQQQSKDQKQRTPRSEQTEGAQDDGDKPQDQQQDTSSGNMNSIEEEPETLTPTHKHPECPELREGAGDVVLADRTRPQGSERAAFTHTERVSADLGRSVSGGGSFDKLDVDTVPTKENGSGVAPLSALHRRYAPEGHALDADDDPKTPMNKANGFKIPSQLPPSAAWPELSSTTLDPNDKQVLCYYSGQLETHSTLLTNAIDAFFNCIESNEPPKVFISNSKFVIVTAHKLVYISDALHRSLINCEVRNKVISCANHVCECLKVSVQATKVAALQWPSLPAVQDMVDRVVDVSHAAHELKLVITQASSLS